MWILLGSWKLIGGLLAVMLLALELGRMAGRRRLRTDPQWDGRGVGALESTVLALLGLLLAFTFSGAWSRYDARRELILKESNAIGTAWLRLDLVASEQPREALRVALRRYVDLRLESTQASEAGASAAVTVAQQAIWAQAVMAAKAAPDGRVAQLLLPAVNDMFDVASARYVAVQTHPPAVVFLMLLAIMLLAALLAGYGMAGGRSRHWLHISCFIGSLVLAVYVTIDLEYPRRGFIRVDHYDQLLVDLRAGMK
jgi:hypothetical protein